MIRTFLNLLIMIAMLVSCAHAQDKPAGPPASLAGAPLVMLEKDLIRAEKSHNLQSIDTALAPEFLEIAGNGRLYTKPEIMEVVKDIQIEDYALENFRVLNVRDDLGIVTYEATVRGSYKGQAFPMRNYLSSTWRRQKNRWQMVFHTSTPIPEQAAVEAPPDALERERRLLDSELHHNVEAIMAVLADDFREIGGDGGLYGKADIPRLLADVRIDEVTAHDMVATPLGSGAVLVTYRVEGKGAFKEKPVPIHFGVSSVWQERGGKWLLVFHQGTVIQSEAAPGTR
jgi:hypothetical protein